MHKIFLKSFLFFIIFFIFCYIFMKFIVFYTKIDFRVFRINYFVEPQLNSLDVLIIERKLHLNFTNSHIFVKERKILVFEFNQRISNEDVERITTFLINSFPNHKWTGPFIREQIYISKNHISRVIFFFSLLFALGASFAYFLERSKNE